MADNSVSLERARLSRTIGTAIAALVVLSTAGREVAARHVVSFEPRGLGTLGGSSSEAFAVSARGVVVGRSSIADDDTCANHAFVWSAAVDHMTDLHQHFQQPLSGGNQSQATMINDNGAIAGFGYLHPAHPDPAHPDPELPPPLCRRDDDASHAFVYTPANGLIDLSTLGGFASVPTAINSKGDVVGYSNVCPDLLGEPCDTPPRDQPIHAFLWTSRDGMIDLGTLGGSTSLARAINDDGVVVGESQTEDQVAHAFMWTREAGRMVDLGTLGGSTSFAQAVSDDGIVVGQSQTRVGDDPAGAMHAFVWTNRGGMKDIGDLRGQELVSFAERINGRVAIGQASSLGAPNHGFAWTRKSGLVDIGTLGGDFSRAAAVNNRGTVVGGSQTTGNAAFRAFAWSLSSGMVELETTDSGTSEATAINDHGLIVGRSCSGNVNCHATLWKPSSHERP